nr:MAG TPA: hypothetical protein [Caudoviricetes sp.]
MHPFSYFGILYRIIATIFFSTSFFSFIFYFFCLKNKSCPILF